MKLTVQIGQIDTNSYVIEENGQAIIIDPAEAENISRIISDNKWNLDYIFLSHEHFDHIGGLEEIRNKYNAPVVACNCCSDRIQQMNDNLSRIADILQFFKTGKSPKERTEPFECNAADITFDDYFKMLWQGHTFSFRRAPGHSPGSVIIFMDEDIVFSGDYMFYDKKETLRLKGGSEEDYNNIVLPILESIPKGTHIYPGHGKDYIKE